MRRALRALQPGAFGFGDANPLLQDVLGQVSSRDVSEAAWDDPEQLQSDYDDFWSGSHRFEPPGEWGNRVQAMTDAMVYEHKRERLEALGLTPDQIISAIGQPPELPEPNVK